MSRSKVATLLAFGNLLIAVLAGASPSRASDEELVARLSREWMTAIEHKDRNVLESLLADDFVLQKPGDAEAQLKRRAEWLENAIGMDWSGFRYENIVAHVQGDHATVSSILRFKIAPFPFTFDSGVVDVWRRRGDRWQVTTRYLGESRLSLRIAFVSGILAAGLAAAVMVGLVRLVRRSRRRSA